MSTEPECWCEHVDIGVGEQKVAENPDCPRCFPDNDRIIREHRVAKVILGGDTHGDKDHVFWLIKKAEEEGAQAVFVLGDFGIWSHFDGGAFVRHVSNRVSRTGISVYFLPGNHENYDLLEQYEKANERTKDGFVVIEPGVFYSPRGHRWTWSGVKFLSLGGAYSIDKPYRVMQDQGIRTRAQVRQMNSDKLTERERYALQFPHLSWWPQEEINDEERDRAIEGGEVDVLLTHDKPLVAKPRWNRKNIPECVPNQEQIQRVVDATKPSLLVHGHLHFAYEDKIQSTDTFVKGLDCDPEASRHSGGSGKRSESFAVLDLDRSRPSTPEPGADADFFSLKWHATDGAAWNRDFVRKES